ALYGLGRPKTVLRLTVIWATAGWALGVPLTIAFGMHGFALAMSIVSWLSILSVREINKVVRVSFVPDLVRVFVCAAVPAALIAVSARFLVHNAFQLAGVALAGVVGYIGLMYASGQLDDVRPMLRMAARTRKPVVAQPVPVEQAVSEHA
ncbi:MAG TPA: polysaccharide biosynthesis C-terminal domain-containing protein, partial [Actinomycetota bacterium]|nr:polysaccharide biosynthesis C-terminal domain-containing protein [Actinomycetota bacterium]